MQRHFSMAGFIPMLHGRRLRLFWIGRTVLLFILFAASVAALPPFLARLWYEWQGPLTADTPVYMAVGRGILNGLVPYRDLYEIKPPGIFFLSAASLALFGDATLASMLQVALLAGFPLLFLVAGEMVRHDVHAPRRWLLRFLALTFGIALALYTGERSGEFQVESYGAFAAMLATWMMLNTGGVWGWRRTGLLAFFLLSSIGLKEPFLLSVTACALILYADKPRSLWRGFVLPLGVAACAGLFIMIVLGYALPYMTVYLPEMLGKHIYSHGSPWSRALLWPLTWRDIWRFDPILAIAILISLVSYVLHGAKSGVLALLRRVAAATAGISLLLLAVGMGGQFYNHHFVFAVPGYAALFIVFLRDTAGDKNLRRSTLSRTAMVALLLVWVLYPRLPLRYAERLQGFRQGDQVARDTAWSIDAVLDSCKLPSYLFLGPNGLHPYAYTVHSPSGPLFFQFPHLLDTNHLRFRQMFLEQLMKADLIVVGNYTIGDFRPVVDHTIAAEFTSDPWPCARSIPPPPARYKFFYRVPGSRKAPSTIGW